MVGLLQLIGVLFLAWAQPAVEFSEPAPDGPAERLKGQSIDRDVLVDHDLQFVLRRLEDGWILLDEPSAQTVFPDASAAITVHGGQYLGVVAEPTSGAALDDMHALVQSGLDSRVSTVRVEERGEFVGLPAWHVVITGVESEARYRQESWRFVSQGWFFQVYATAVIAHEDDPVDATRMFDAFERLPGVPVGRAVRPLQDQATRQWSVTDGVYEDAAFGLRWAPGPDYRLAVGRELLQMSESARVGVFRAAPEFYMVLIPERVGSAEAPAVIRYLYDQFWEDFSLAESLPVMTLRVGDQLVDFVGGTLDAGVGGQAWHGVAHAGELAVQLQFWFIADQDPEAIFREVASVLETLSFQSGQERATLAEQLVESAWPGELGLAWRWRDGVLHHHEQDLAWTARTQHWDVLGGDAAVLSYGDGSLFSAADPSRGFVGVVRVIEAEGSTKTVLQARLQEDFAGEPDGRVRKVRFADARGLEFTTTTRDGELSYTWRYALAPAGPGRFVLVEGWSLGSVAEPAAEAFEELVSNLQITVPLDDVDFGLEGFRSDRLGFAQATLPGMRCEEQTPAQVQSRGTLLMCVGRADQAAMTMAVHGVPAGSDPEKRVELVKSMLGESTLTRFGRSWTERDLSLAGHPATVIVMDPPGSPIEITVTVVGPIIYMAMTVGLEPAQADHWRAGFSLLP